MDKTEIIKITLLILMLVVAAIYDIRYRRIPNWLTYPVMLLSVVYQTYHDGTIGFLLSLAGIGVGLLVFVIPYLTKGMGAGDVKLMGAIGGVLGPKGVFIAFLFTAICGGVYALILTARHGFFRETVARYVRMLKSFFLSGRFVYVEPAEKLGKPVLPYGVAIAFGTLFSLALPSWL